MLQPTTGWIFADDDMPVVPGSDTITQGDCAQGGWCRQEICLDHDWDDGSPDDNKARARCRIHALGSGKTRTWDGISTNRQSTADVGSKWFNIQRTRTDFGEPGYGVFRGIAYVMVASQTPADPRFWIGPAYEVTDGVGSPPTETPPPPEAPTLLP